MTALPWQDAWHQALYAPGGFFTTGAGPIAHFRTAVHAAAVPLAAALLRLAEQHGRTAVLDVGAGRGELLTALAALPQAAGLRLNGVDVVPRPDGLPSPIGWWHTTSPRLHDVPAEVFDDALVVAWELLDDVPCPVLELDDDGRPRLVLVEPTTGREQLGPPPDEQDLAWCRRWWPLEQAEPGDRVEVGRPRDQLWAALVDRAAGTTRGALLLAVDYGHARTDRPPLGSLAGYRAGRAVPPVPDGSCDITAHVALDAVAAAGAAAGAADTRLTDQRTALLELGVGAADERADERLAPAEDGVPPGVALLRRLARRGEVAELLYPGSLGGFGWLTQRAGG